MIELFCNEVLFAGLVIAGTVVDGPSCDISRKRINNGPTLVHCYLTFLQTTLPQFQDHLVFFILQIYFDLHEQDL